MITKEELLSKTPLFLNDFKTLSDVYAEYRPKGVETEWDRTGRVFSNPDAEETQYLKNYKILYATYLYEDYEGRSFVLGYDTSVDKFFEVQGSHCSCYGLEDQWDMEYFDSFEQLIQALEKRRDIYVYGNTFAQLRDFLGLPKLTDEDAD